MRTNKESLALRPNKEFLSKEPIKNPELYGQIRNSYHENQKRIHSFMDKKEILITRKNP
jgi:hypothetical protein